MRSLLLLAGILFALWMPAWCLESWWLAAALPLLIWRPLRPLVLVLFGIACAWLAMHRVSMPPPLQPGERVLVHAAIQGVPSHDASGWQFDALIRFPRHNDWPAQRWRVRAPAAAMAPAAGELWQLALRFDPAVDPGERRRLLAHRIGAQARVVAGALNIRLSPARRGLDGLRERLARRIADRVADPAAAALLAALAVGVTGEVTTRQWQVFNATGVTHLVAISGMHVTFFAMLSMAAARRTWPLLAAMRWMPRRDCFAAAVGVAMALLYALLSGFAVPAQRTVVMLAAFLLARECGRCSRGSWSIEVALVAVLLFDPLAALSAGFWLSFLAVAAIVLLGAARVDSGAPLPAAVRMQWLVSIALLPVTVAIFGSFSAVGLLANALAIPVFTLLLVPPVLVATAFHLLPGAVATGCGDALVSLAAAVAAGLWPFLCWCAGLPAALWQAAAPLGWYPLAAGAALLVLLPVPRVQRLLALLLLGSVFLLRDPRPRPGDLWVDVVASGASSALMLRTRDRLVLWGTGETYGTGGRSFLRRLQPLLRTSGYGAIDLWLPGNLTRDVQAALQFGAARIEVHDVLLPPARNVPPEMRACKDGAWIWDGVQFELRVGEGGRTCELAVRRGDQVLMLGGKEPTYLPDASRSGRQLLLDEDGLQQRPHHLRL